VRPLGYRQVDFDTRAAVSRAVHAEVSLTMNTYTHVLPDTREVVAKKIVETSVWPVGIKKAERNPGQRSYEARVPMDGGKKWRTLVPIMPVTLMQ
jgi:hypothetical protein